MLNDYWVIAQLLGQFCTLLLLIGGAGYSAYLIRNWRQGASTELQITLERQSYLIGAIVQFGLFFQVLLLLMFLNTVNIHLTGQIEGAMCATGVLGINDYGYPLLYLKLGSLLGYMVYLILNYFDQREPEYPLTPLKFWWIFPALLLMSLDFFWTFRFFGSIEPDIIATCCSVSFLVENTSPYALYAPPLHLENYLVIWCTAFIALLLMTVFWQRKIATLRFWAVQLLLALLYLWLSVYVLKYFFVKYIYALPSHNCLFDIFWAKYYYIGYLLFGVYFGVLCCGLLGLLYHVFLSKLRRIPFRFWQDLQILYTFFLLLSFIIPWLYWYAWDGVL